MNIFSSKRPKYGDDPSFVPNTIVGEGVTFRGMIKGSGAVMISGFVFGDIHVDGEVIISETGYVRGDIASTFAVVSGIVEGNINLSSYASLKYTASVTGDISCTALDIDDGAEFKGESKMIVKNSSLAKKKKRIMEQAAAMESWAPADPAHSETEVHIDDSEDPFADDVHDEPSDVSTLDTDLDELMDAEGEDAVWTSDDNDDSITKTEDSASKFEVKGEENEMRSLFVESDEDKV